MVAEEKKESEERKKESTAAAGGGSGGGGGSGSGSSASDGIDRLTPLPRDLKNRIASFLDTERVGLFAATAKVNREAFEVNPKLVRRALEAILEGDPKTLKRLLNKDPEIFFTPFNAKDPAEQRFENVSPFKLIQFLADDDMLIKHILPMSKIQRLLRAEQTELDERAELLGFDARGIPSIKSRYTTQIEEMTGGGPDIVNINFDPMTLTEETFGRLESISVAEALPGITPPPFDVRFSLLENADGILCYQNKDEVKWYYVDKERKIIKPLDCDALMREVIDAIKDDADKAKVLEEYNQFKAACRIMAPEIKMRPDGSIDDAETAKTLIGMEPNSARRSNIKEHAFIKKYLYNQYKDQKGIIYTDMEGQRYRDTHFPFNDYYNKARACWRLNMERKTVASDLVWQKLVGPEQKRLIWRLQYLCQKDYPFYPLTADFLTSKQANKRDLTLYDRTPVWARGAGFLSGFGPSFSLYKGGGSGDRVLLLDRDLIALLGLVEDAKLALVRRLSIFNKVGDFEMMQGHFKGELTHLMVKKLPK